MGVDEKKNDLSWSEDEIDSFRQSGIVKGTGMALMEDFSFAVDSVFDLIFWILVLMFFTVVLVVVTCGGLIWNNGALVAGDAINRRIFAESDGLMRK